MIGRRFAVGGVTVQVLAMDEHDGVHSMALSMLAAQLHAVCSIPAPPPRIEEWGPGQFDRVTIAPGIEAWIRITPAGRVRMIVPGGDLDVTDGSAALGTGLHEAGARAAQIRVGLRARATRRAEKHGHEITWNRADEARCTRCGCDGELYEDGRARGEMFTERCG
jgi:hypothetical protein